MRKAIVLLAALQVSAAWGAYRCVDERGITHVGDTPPAGCGKVMLYEINRNGTVVREIEPTPTPEQVAARRQEFERRRAAERIAAEQKRKDTVLLSTFASEAEFDVVRDRTVEPVRARIGVARERIAEVDKRLRVIEQEVEFHVTGKSRNATRAPPHHLLAEQERLRRERQSLLAAIAGHEKEIASLRARFDSDKRRWVAIKSGAAGKAPQAQPVRNAY